MISRESHTQGEEVPWPQDCSDSVAREDAESNRGLFVPAI